jgi:hypothetical protein
VLENCFLAEIDTKHEGRGDVSGISQIVEQFDLLFTPALEKTEIGPDAHRDYAWTLAAARTDSSKPPYAMRTLAVLNVRVKSS